MTACTVVLCASAGNKFVSQTTGADSNDGLSWATAKQTLANGFSACATGDTLFVAFGTYNERLTITEGKYVSILGGYNINGDRDIDAFQTIIDGSDLGKILIKAEKESSIPLLFEGLTLQNSEYSSSSSAMYMRGNMTLKDCVIRNCSSASNGGAIYVDITDSSKPAAIINCIFELCTAAGGGGAIYNKGALIENCIFRGCSGVYGTVCNRSGILKNCLFHNNSAVEGDWPNSGGVYNPGGQVINCTFANNWGKEYAGIHSNGPVYNSVFWGNKPQDGFKYPANFIEGSPSCNNIANEGFESASFLSLELDPNNLAEKGPHFVAPTEFVGVPKTPEEIEAMRNADFSIEAGSFLINKGKNDVAPETDIRGVARPKEGTVDVGAYEYDPDAPEILLEKIAIYLDTITLHEKKSAELKVIFTPRNASDKSIQWSIDDPNIATIDKEGKVTAVSEGFTVVRAYNEKSNLKDTAVVEVLAALPIKFPKEVLDAEATYLLGDYTIPTFLEFLVAKQEARIDSLDATEEEIASIAAKIEVMNAKIAKLQSKEEPYNLVATFNGDPKTHMGFCWFTNEGITEGKVQIIDKADATAADFEASGVITVDATPTTTKPLHITPIQANELPTYDICTAAGLPRNTAFKYVSHKALADNLTPGTVYSWRVGYEGHWSDIAQFRTQDAEQGDFSFVYMTDSHIQDAEYITEANKCAKAVVKHEKDAKFCLFPGDFVETGGSTNSEWQWERWFEEAVHPVLMNMALVPTDGNHDDSPLLNYDYHFNTDWSFANAAETKPQFQGIAYSFVYGDVLFIVFSMQDYWRAHGTDKVNYVCSYLSNDITNWFKEQVEKYPNTKYRVTLAHKNIFSASGHQHDSETPLFREIMLPLFKECEIDLAIQGHDHCYEVIGPVDPDTRTVVPGSIADTVRVSKGGTSENMTGLEGGTFTTDEGTVYFIGATCGAKRYYPLTRAEMDADYSKHKVTNYYDLVTSKFGQPEAPSYTRFNVTDAGIEMITYKVDANGNKTVYNTINVKRTKPHSLPTGVENVQEGIKFRDGEKFIHNGQLYILKDGMIYNVIGQKIAQ